MHAQCARMQCNGIEVVSSNKVVGLLHVRDLAHLAQSLSGLCEVVLQLQDLDLDGG